MTVRPLQTISVSRLSGYLKRVLTADPELKELAVRGEVTGFRPPSASSRQIYFSLKDEGAVISCVVWPENVAKIPPLRDGARIVVHGGIDVFVRGGRYQLNVRALELDGEGALFVALELLRKKLQLEGCFAVERKRALPRYPFAVALVSSATAQGANDFRQICARRSPHIALRLIETAVQGESAGEQIAAAIALAAKSGADCIALVRGGGATEDLWAFNHEAVVRAIVAASIPVLTGIGHESDTTLADFAADVHAMTPSEAAGRLPALADVRMLVRGYGDALNFAVARTTGLRRQRLAGLNERLERRSPAAQLAARRSALAAARHGLARAMAPLSRMRAERLTRAATSLPRAAALQLERGRGRYQFVNARLTGLDPDEILRLGYAVVRIGGRAIADATAVRPGEVLEARLARGTLTARVETVEYDGRASGTAV